MLANRCESSKENSEFFDAFDAIVPLTQLNVAQWKCRCCRVFFFPPSSSLLSVASILPQPQRHAAWHAYTIVTHLSFFAWRLRRGRARGGVLLSFAFVYCVAPTSFIVLVNGMRCIVNIHAHPLRLGASRACTTT